MKMRHPSSVPLIFSAVLLVSLLLETAAAFSTPKLAGQYNTRKHSYQLIGQPPSVRQHQRQRHQSTLLFERESDGGSGGDNSGAKRRKKRVRRKEESSSDTESKAPPTSTPAPELKAREDTGVNLQVMDVRDLVGGGSATSSSSTPTSQESFSSSAKPSSEAPITSKQGSNSATSTGTGTNSNSDMDESLKMLLEDAREMQALEKKGSSSVSSGATTEEGGDTEFSIPDTFRKILSSIVTVDFFVVCGFLLWFLLGIFCSYILKNDDVQIAFNLLFQPVVQPALGILMIGSIAGSAFEKNEEEEI